MNGITYGGIGAFKGAGGLQRLAMSIHAPGRPVWTIVSILTLEEALGEGQVCMTPGQRASLARESVQGLIQAAALLRLLRPASSERQIVCGYFETGNTHGGGAAAAPAGLGIQKSALICDRNKY
jgi:hypothetical protein